jgi:hypothetical protein
MYLKVNIMTNNPRFWPFEDPEGEIYDSLAWDLPGLRRKVGPTNRSRRKNRRDSGEFR